MKNQTTVPAAWMWKYAGAVYIMYPPWYRLLESIPPATCTSTSGLVAAGDRAVPTFGNDLLLDAGGFGAAGDGSRSI